jgi:alpha-D-xyloside xylohydrolase
MSGKVVRMRDIAVMALALLLGGVALAQSGPFVFERDGRVISLVPYAPNILRVTISRDKTAAIAGPGYGIIAEPNAGGWTHDKDAQGNEVFRSSRMVVRLAPGSQPQKMPLDALNIQLREIYFGAGNGGQGPREDALAISTPDGKSLVEMRSWSMYRTGSGTGWRCADWRERPGADIPTYKVGSVFDSGADEHYYGLGQQQQGGWTCAITRSNAGTTMARRGASRSACRSWSRAVAMVYCGITLRRRPSTWDSTGRNAWSSEVGDRVSYFVIAGETSDEIYAGYRLLTGVTHMLPEGRLRVHPEQGDLPDAGAGPGHRQGLSRPQTAPRWAGSGLPEHDQAGRDGPRPQALARSGGNEQGTERDGDPHVLSVWPHYAPGTQFYDMLKAKGWFISTRDGKPDAGWGHAVIGPNLDTTNPEAARWFWEKIRDRYVKPFGFDYIWLDETEPDYDPANDMFYLGSGLRYYNIYPLFHTASVYDGFRRDFGDSRRVMILSRAAYTGAQRNGTVFWSSDIQATWDMLKRSVPAGLNFAATGLPYWDTDIAGFFAPYASGGLSRSAQTADRWVGRGRQHRQL